MDKFGSKFLIWPPPNRDVEAIDRFRFRGWDSYEYFYYKMEAEAEAVEAALKSTASTSLAGLIWVMVLLDRVSGLLPW